MDRSGFGRARKHLIRSALAGLVALAGMVVARFGQLSDDRRPLDEATYSEQVLAVLGSALLLLAGVIAVRSAARAVRVAMEAKVGDGRGAPLGLVVSAFGYLLLLLAVLSALGVPLEGFLLGGALTGVVIGIAAQQTLGNFFAGIVLLAVRPFTIGETVVLRSGPLGGEYEGAVLDMGLFYVRMVTADGPVQLPNAGVLASAIGPGARDRKEQEEEEAPPHEGGAP